MTLTYLMLAVIASQIADAVTTIVALKKPNLKEANGLLRPLFAKFGVAPVMIVKGAALTVLAYYLGPEGQMIIAGITGLVALNNVRVIYK